jgi:phosphoesterase RecJ-like protein
MPEHQSNIDLAAAADLISKADGTIFITTHAKPDGDAFGSVVALASALQKMGKQTFPCFAPPVPAQLSDLKGIDLTHTLRDDLVIPACSLYIVVDTGAWSQVEPMRKTLESNLARTLIIDHHLSGDIDAAHKYVDASAGACAEIIAELLGFLDGGAKASEAWDATITEALLVGIGSDTGWFRFSNTRPQTHRLAARLLEMGVNHTDLYARLHQTERPAKLTLLTRALDSLTLLADSQAAVMSLTQRDFKDSGALEEETERLIDIPQQVKSIQVVALVTESSIDTPEGKQPLARISFRSKPGPDAVNVADLASQFGGGGHARAAGAKLPVPIEEAVERVSQAVKAAFES